MSKKIPRSIQEKVIKKWLEGKSRDLVARELKISGGSVTSIIQMRRKKDRQFDLLRVVAIHMRELGITVESFAPLVRIRNLIQSEYSGSSKSVKLEEVEEKIDTLFEALVVLCFNRKQTIVEFGNIVHNLIHEADQLGKSLSDLPAYVSVLMCKVNAIRQELVLLKNKKEELLNDYEVTMGVINDILQNGPYMLGAYLDMKAQLRMIENERNEYKIKLENLRLEMAARDRDDGKGHWKTI